MYYNIFFLSINAKNGKINNKTSVWTSYRHLYSLPGPMGTHLSKSFRSKQFSGHLYQRYFCCLSKLWKSWKVERNREISYKVSLSMMQNNLRFKQNCEPAWHDKPAWTWYSSPWSLRRCRWEQSGRHHPAEGWSSSPAASGTHHSPGTYREKG